MDVELETEVEVDGELITAIATFEVVGEYRPGSFGPDPEPPEYPEANLLSLTFGGHALSTSLIDEEEYDRLTALAVEAAQEVGPDPE